MFPIRNLFGLSNLWLDIKKNSSDADGAQKQHTNGGKPIRVMEPGRKKYGDSPFYGVGWAKTLIEKYGAAWNEQYIRKNSFFVWFGRL